MKIKKTERPNYERTIEVSTKIEVSNRSIGYDSGSLNFVTERLDPLASYTEKLAVAQSIANSVKSNIESSFTQDIAGNPFRVSIYYRDDDFSVAATIVYSCENGNFVETTPW